jgi:hypothetical protein
LEGIVNPSLLGALPLYWQNVPYSDVNCLALNLYEDSPDLTNLIAPFPIIGINGNPFSGNTFISGLFGTDDSLNHFFQEGIMQNVSGFTIDSTYEIRFHQTVVRNNNALDKSGSWAVYIDTVLVGITQATNTNEAIGSTTLLWESRTISFTAKSNTHFIKFLPMDDDNNHISSLTDTLGALRMGIDSIGFISATGIGLQETNNKIDFDLIPNPNQGSFELRLKGEINKPIFLYITDVYGKHIETKEIINNTTEFENTSLCDGLYFYSLRQGVEEVSIGKFLIVK